MTTTTRHVIFGTGAIGLATLDALRSRGEAVRLVNRSGHAHKADDVEVVGRTCQRRGHGRRVPPTVLRKIRSGCQFGQATFADTPQTVDAVAGVIKDGGDRAPADLPGPRLGHGGSATETSKPCDPAATAEVPEDPRPTRPDRPKVPPSWVIRPLARRPGAATLDV